VREQPDALEYVADRPAQLDRVAIADVPTINLDASRTGVDQTVDHLQRGRLAASRRTEQHEGFPVGYRQGHLVDGEVPTTVK
jgi:hypothetical protein